jgi:hypothetical protein
MTELVIAPCASKAARYAVEHWHYSRRMPTPPCACYGAWESGRYIGAVIFSPGASQHMPRQFGLHPRAVTELTRVALREHEHHVSEIVAATIDLLRRDSSGLQLIVSFADPAHGHVGKIYQAMNWLYLGESDPSTNYVNARGDVLHARVVTKDGWTTQYGMRKRGHVASELRKVTVPGKHRYALPLSRSLRRRLIKQALPYPRGRGLDGEPSVLLTEGAGSTPAARSQ